MKVVKHTTAENLFHFHFRGVCSGEALKKVILKGNKDLNLKKGEEYLMYVQLVSFEVGTLKGNIIKCKALDECWDKS